MAGPKYEIDPTGRVVRRDAGGKVAWATRLGRPFNFGRDGGLAWDEWRVYVSLEDGVTALDATTGKPLWQGTGASKSLHVSGRLVLAAGAEGFVGRGAATGVRAFQVQLPAERFGGVPTWSVREVAGLFLVQTEGGCDEPALLIDRQGSVRYRFKSAVVEARLVGKEGVFLSGGEVVVASAGREGRWVLPFTNPESPPGGGFVVLKGDLVAFRYSRIAGSGVQLIRFNAATGKAVWRADCAPLGVDYAKFRHHAAVTVEGGRLCVTSVGLYGTFVELLDVKTGKQLKRTVP
jgi:outer membrane protein assembly factor BamB